MADISSNSTSNLLSQLTSKKSEITEKVCDYLKTTIKDGKINEDIKYACDNIQKERVMFMEYLSEDNRYIEKRFVVKNYSKINKYNSVIICVKKNFEGFDSDEISYIDSFNFKTINIIDVDGNIIHNSYITDLSFDNDRREGFVIIISILLFISMSVWIRSSVS